jgi:hypothetical protein
MMEGLIVFKNEHTECDGCALGKQNGNEFPIITDKRKREIIELVHSNVCGPMKTKSLGGTSYFLIFIDDRPIFAWVYFIRKKSGVFKYFKYFTNLVEK